MVAIFIALSGSAVAANLAGERGSPIAKVAKKKKVKPGPRGLAGPQGLQGLQGIQGVQGPPGPTLGDFIGGVTAVAAEGFGIGNTVTPPVAGRLLVMLSVDIVNVACSSPTNVDVGLYVGNVPVNGTFRTISHATNTRIDVYGVSGPVSASTHNVQLGAACQGAPTVSIVTTSANNFSIGAVLLGS